MKKITCIGLATAAFALMFSSIYGLHELMDDDCNIVLTILMGTLYCIGITAYAVVGAILWCLAFATGNTEEETTEEAGV